MNSRLATQALAMVREILEAEQRIVFDLKVVLFSSTDPNYIFTVPWFTSFDIVQDFGANAFDVIHAACEVQMSAFLAVLAHRQDLHAKVSWGLRPSITTGEVEPLWSGTYKVVVTTEPNPHLEHNINQVVTLDPATETPTSSQTAVLHPLEFDLYHEEMVTLRKETYNFIAAECTIAQLVYLLAHLHGIKRVRMVPPDNQRVYPQLTLPSILNFRSALNYLQEGPGLGIYDHACCYYYRDDTLYVFPRFKVGGQGTDNRTAHLYLIPNWEMGNGVSFHRIDEIGDLHLIINDVAETMNTAAIAMENIGTSSYLLHTDRLVDSDPKWMQPTGINLPNDLVSLIEFPGEDGFFGNTHTPLYRPSSGNLHKFRSELAAGRNTLMTATWEEAIPFELYPGQRIHCHYLKSDSLPDQPIDGTKFVYERQGMGIVNRVVYVFQRETHETGYCYHCSASLILQLDEEL